MFRESQVWYLFSSSKNKNKSGLSVLLFWVLFWVKYIKAKKVLKTIVQIIDSISNENQQNFWQDNRSFGYCFENEQSKINFISSEISWDQILEPMTFEESHPRCIFILGKWYVCKRKSCLTFVDWCKYQKNSKQSF